MIVSLLASPRVQRYGLNGLACLFIALALIGAFRSYSAVPYWDMWDSYLPLLDQVASGDWSVWWHQHNEHRIVLSRLFFWADLRWFDGAGWFLVTVNYLLVALGALLFCRMLREHAAAHERSIALHALTAFTVICLFFWSQSENLTWGFQSQFILAQLLPLTALYALHRALDRGAGAFALACMLGILSALTMANGILALPLMGLYALLTRQGVRRVGVLLVLAVLTVWAYFHDYSSPAGHGSLTQALKESPEHFARYVFTYLGSPFNYALGGGKLGKIAALVAGMLFVAAVTRVAWQTLRAPRQASLQLALLSFLAYIGGTAVGTAAGRAKFGVDQALSHRYTTPALMAWVALLILSAPTLLALQGWRRRLAYGALGLLLLPMLAFQSQALQSRADEMFDRAAGALAIELRIRDQQEIGHVYPSPDVIIYSEKAADSQRSVFGMYPYRGARAQMGTMFAQQVLPACEGHIDIANMAEGDARYLRVEGWLYEPAGKMAPQVVRFLDASGKQVGYAIGGRVRNDVAAAVGTPARSAGYRGYLSASDFGPTVTLRGEGRSGPFCEQRLKAPQQLPYIITREEPTPQRATVSSASVLEGNEWQGADFFKTQVPGMRVYGSFIGSDADRGTIALRVKRGDRLFYRSGPAQGQQTLEIAGLGTVNLPLSREWTLLEFSGEALPKEPFIAKLTDQGNGWGEWSAIAIQQ